MKYDVLNEINFSQVEPKGWLKKILENERDGMPGHLDEIGYPYDLPCWQLKSMTDGGFEAWWPYEQTGYWIDSVTRAALLLRDNEFLQKVKSIIDESIENAQDGFIGPEDLKNDTTQRSRWPQAVYFRALYALWSGTGDSHYLEVMRKHYLLEYNKYERDRDGVNIETMLRVADILEDNELREKAKASYAEVQKNAKAENMDYYTGNMLSDVSTYIHGVTLNEMGKLPAVYYSAFGDEEQLKAAIHLYEKIHKDHILPDGVHSSQEKTCGNDSLKAHESCNITDYTWSLSYLLAATGNGKYADRIERAIFNAAPGAIAPHFRAIQYLSSVNQVRAARNSTTAEAFRNTPRMAYQPHHYPECCVGNIGRAFPNYILHMYWESAGGFSAVLYGDSVFTGDEYTVTQRGSYPFNDKITFKFQCENPKHLRVGLRIPEWCKAPEVYVNGEKKTIVIENGFTFVEHTFKSEDVITLRLPMTFSAHESSDKGVYFDYGPLLLALKIKEKWTVDNGEPRQTANFPAYDVEPESAWNYAVTGKENPVIRRNTVSDDPWWSGYPLEFDIPARIINGWTTEIVTPECKDDSEGINNKQVELGATEIKENLELTPPLPTPEFIRKNIDEDKTVTLVPYGCTHLRISIFPKAVVAEKYLLI